MSYICDGHRAHTIHQALQDCVFFCGACILFCQRYGGCGKTAPIRGFGQGRFLLSILYALRMNHEGKIPGLRYGTYNDTKKAGILPTKQKFYTCCQDICRVFLGAFKTHSQNRTSSRDQTYREYIRLQNKICSHIEDFNDFFSTALFFCSQN